MATPRVSAAVWILASLASAVLTAQSGNDSVDAAKISSLIRTVASKNRSEIVHLINYPFAMRYPEPSVTSAEECLKRFDEVFDDSLLNDIAHSDPKSDWERVGWRGVMLGNGEVWLDDDYKIIAINHQTENEKLLRARLIDQQKRRLPPSLRNFDEPVLEWTTRHFLVRVDKRRDDFRLAVFEGHSYAKLLHAFAHGDQHFDGSGGSYYIDWKADGRTYRVYVDAWYEDSSYYEYGGAVGPPGLDDHQPALEEHGHERVK